MTPEEKIAALVEHIKKEFPEGCIEVPCRKCVLKDAESRTPDAAICNGLYQLMKYSG